MKLLWLIVIQLNVEEQEKLLEEKSRLEATEAAVTAARQALRNTVPVGMISSARRDTFSMLITGMSGVGKTHLLGTIEEVPEMLPALFIDTDGGTATVAHRETFGYVRLTRLEQLSPLKTFLQTPANKFNTVIIDSYTKIHSMFEDQIHEYQSRTKATEVEKITRRFEFQDYGALLRESKALLNALKRCNVNLICTAGATVDGSEFSTDLAGRMKKDICFEFDIVGYIAMVPVDKKNLAGPMKRVLFSTTRPNRHPSKSRYNKLPGAIEDPTMRGIYDAVQESKSWKEE